MTVESVKPAAPEVPELLEPPVAGGRIPLLGHGWKLVRDPWPSWPNSATTATW